MHTRTAILTCTGLAAAMFCGQPLAAQNDHTGWYVGGLVGVAKTDTEVDGLVDQKENAGAFGVYGGYNFTRWFGLEGSIMETGDVGDDRADLDSAGFGALTLTPRFSLHLNDTFSLFGKFGYAFVAYGEEYDDYNSDVGDDEALWYDSLITYGLGAQIATPVGVNVRLSHDVFRGELDDGDLGFNSVPDADIDWRQWSLGVHYQF